VKVRPKTLDSSTGQLRRIDDTWIVRSASSEGPELHNLRTRDTIRLGIDQVREYLSAPAGKGLTNKEIASRLNLSEFTVRNHIHRILKQVDAGSRSEAVQTIRAHGFAINP
jgi:DNA-directed RNA polymerase specialized sigma24 family protein